MERRAFIKLVGGAAGASTLCPDAVSGTEKKSKAGKADAAPLPRRKLGRTGLEISVVGFPGLALVHQGQKECTAAIKRSFELGLNYFDVAPAYGNGDAEIKLGVGLQGIDRTRYFLACKTKRRDREGARRELERSLKRLKTGHFDVYQLHCLRTPEEVEKALGPDGAVEAFVKAKKEGKVRFLGFSAHTTKAALGALKGFKFDTVMFPINFIEIFKIGFGKPVLDSAKKHGAGVLAIKPMCGGAWPKGMKRTRKWWYRPLEKQQVINMALRFTLSQEGVAAGFPPAFLDLLDKALVTGRSYSTITKRETDKLRKLARDRLSVFEKEEKRVASGFPREGSLYPDSPHECSPCAIA